MGSTVSRVRRLHCAFEGSFDESTGALEPTFSDDLTLRSDCGPGDESLVALPKAWLKW